MLLFVLSGVIRSIKKRGGGGVMGVFPKRITSMDTNEIKIEA